MKIVLRLFALLLLFAALAVGGAVLFQDRLISRAIEEGGSYGTGVPTKVETVDAGLFSGKLELGGLSITDPCLSWEATVALVRELARAQRALRTPEELRRSG